MAFSAAAALSRTDRLTAKGKRDSADAADSRTELQDLRRDDCRRLLLAARTRSGRR
jgi:hypothetical protein